MELKELMADAAAVKVYVGDAKMIAARTSRFTTDPAATRGHSG